MELKGLYKKINYVQTALYEISKGGKNTFAHYNYKTFTNIKQAFNSLLKETGLVFLPTNKHITPEQMQLETRRQEKENNKTIYPAMVKYMQEWAIIDSDDDKEHDFFFPALGTNNDGEDKANGSDTTYTLKYLFNLWGLIPDESLDPDNEQGQREEQPKKVMEQKSPITAEMKKMLKLINSNSPEGDVLKEHMQAMIGKPKDEWKVPDIVNGIQNDENRMKELREIIK